MSNAVELIPVTLLTGFLGSGKTTVLNHLVRQPELADALVIINEFGEMALDHMLVAHSTENLVMEMSSGCLCCTVRGDLVKTLREITWRFSRDGQRQFGRVLIETTGLADPAPIIHTLMTHPQIAARYRLDGVIATVDMATGMATLDQHREAIKQAAMADVLVLTKSDLVSNRYSIELFDRLRNINPTATVWSAKNGIIEPQKILYLGLFNKDTKAPDVARWLKEEAFVDNASHEHNYESHGDNHLHKHEHEHHNVNRHDDHIRAFCFSINDPISEELLQEWLDLLMYFLGGNILRVKGILNVDGNPFPLVVHGVQHIFHPPISLPAWPSEDRRSRMVFITQDVGKEMIEKTFKALRRGEEAQRTAQGEERKS
jgi:G3E family GTPase